MKVRLIRPARIRHEAGETVSVSPAEAAFLISCGSAVEVPEAAPLRETPEDNLIPPEVTAEQVDKTPETKTAARKNTRTKK